MRHPLLGGIWILHTFPALVGGLFTRWFHRWALLAGWAVGMIHGTAAAYGVASPTQKHFGGSAKEIPGIGEIGYIAARRRPTEASGLPWTLAHTIPVTLVHRGASATCIRPLRRESTAAHT